MPIGVLAGPQEPPRELVSYDAWEEKGGKMLGEINYGWSSKQVSLAMFSLDFRDDGFFVLKQLVMSRFPCNSLRDFPYMLKGRASAIQSSKNRTIPSDSHVHVSSSKMF